MKPPIVTLATAALLLGLEQPAFPAGESNIEKATLHLLDRMNEGLPCFIYKDVAWPGNLDFVPSGFMDDWTNLKLSESYKRADVSGTCIKLEYSGSKWAEVYWQRPRNNWGDGNLKFGRDLTGATALSFRAKSADSPIHADFGIGGISGPSGDSTRKISDRVELGTEWKKYTLNLEGENLQHIIGGFLVGMNHKGAILIDDVRFDISRPAATPRFMPSFQVRQPSTHHPVNLCAAHIYDNALAMIAHARIARDPEMPDDLRINSRDHLRIMAEAVRTVMSRDRAYTDGRLRNVYWGGADLLDATGKARLNGWYSSTKQAMLEDKYGVSTHTGNMAWMGMAMIEAWKTLQKPDTQGSYLTAATRIASWINRNTKSSDALAGFTGGFEGWEKTSANPKEPTKILWRSTEHNLDVLALATRLHEITGEAKWLQMAQHAEKFVGKMFNSKAGYYWTGTLASGSVNKSVIPLDCQTWAALTLGDTPETRRAILWALANLRAEGEVAGKPVIGYSFGTAHNGIWPEGAAQMALACDLLGYEAKAAEARKSLTLIQASHPMGNGSGIVASLDEFLATGFTTNTYFAIPHVGATAWFILAQAKRNPMR